MLKKINRPLWLLQRRFPLCDVSLETRKYHGKNSLMLIVEGCYLGMNIDEAVMFENEDEHKDMLVLCNEIAQAIKSSL